MLLAIFGFLHLGFIDILDILMVAFIIYIIFHWIKGSAAMNIFLALLLLFVVRVIVAALNMKMMSALMGALLDVGLLALIIIFQPEIRHFLIRLGSSYGITGKTDNFLSKLFGIKKDQMGSESVKEITEACRSMSEQKTGALIVIPHKTPLDSIAETGDIIDASVNKRLIMNLFFKNSPLHDGAVIISDNRIVAARCTLPMTARTDIPANFGMRHKAAIGISEESDADVIVVSEQTGEIVFVKDGKVTDINNINELKLLLGNALEKEMKRFPDKGQTNNDKKIL
jgi:uncharacterized protein (TIGR00159 family)